MTPLELSPIPGDWEQEGNWSIFTPPTQFKGSGSGFSFGWLPVVLSKDRGFRVSARILTATGTSLTGIALAVPGRTSRFEFMVDTRNMSGASSSFHARRNETTTGTQSLGGNLEIVAAQEYDLGLDFKNDQVTVSLIRVATNEVLLDNVVLNVTLSGYTGDFAFIGPIINGSGSVKELTVAIPVLRAADHITLSVLPAPTYTRMYYLKQAAGLTPPGVPTTNPPPAPWSTVEPTYMAGSTDTVYTIWVTAYGSTVFEYGTVQKSAAFDAAQQAWNAANAALTAASTADGRVTTSTAIPVAADAVGKPEGAVWFRRSTTLPQFTGVWELVAGAWISRQLTNDTIATLNAAKINAGTLNADRIGANSIGVQKMLITSFENLIQDPSFEYNTTQAWVLTAPGVNGTTSPRTGLRSLSVPTQATAYQAARQTAPFAVREGEQYRFGAWVALTTGVAHETNGVALRLASSATEGGTYTVLPDLVSTPPDLDSTMTYISGDWVVPAGVKFVKLDIVQRDVVTGKMYIVDDVDSFKMLQGELIVDGAIRGIKIAAEEITAVHLAARSVATPHLQAQAVDAESIATNAIVGRHLSFEVVEGQHIKAGTLTVNHISPTFGNEIILDGNISIISAKSDAAAAVDAIGNVSADVAEMQTYYKFGPNGAEISSPGSVFSTAIRNDRIEQLENGNVISYWNSGTLYVNQLQSPRLTMANHQIESFGDGSVVRSLG